MPRKRDGFVPISKVDVRLPGIEGRAVRTFRRMLTRAGFEVTAETGILFIPGWLRMLDLACYTWARPLSRLTGLAVAPFHHLSRWLPWLRRYGYLLATVAVRPAAAGAPSPQRVS